jgi:hypothetical protein
MEDEDGDIGDMTPAQLRQRVRDQEIQVAASAERIQQLMRQVKILEQNKFDSDVETHAQYFHERQREKWRDITDARLKLTQDQAELAAEKAKVAREQADEIRLARLCKLEQEMESKGDFEKLDDTRITRLRAEIEGECKLKLERDRLAVEHAKGHTLQMKKMYEDRIINLEASYKKRINTAVAKAAEKVKKDAENAFQRVAHQKSIEAYHECMVAQARIEAGLGDYDAADKCNTKSRAKLVVEHGGRLARDFDRNPGDTLWDKRILKDKRWEFADFDDPRMIAEVDEGVRERGPTHGGERLLPEG